MLVSTYEHTTAIVASITKLDEAWRHTDALVAGAGAAGWPCVFHHQQFADSVRAAVDLAGSRLDPAEVESLLAGEAVDVAPEERTRVLNYGRSIRWVDMQAGNPLWSVTRESLATLHFLANTELGESGEPVGRYRSQPLATRRRVSPAAAYLAPPAGDVAVLMDEFVGWLGGHQAQTLDPWVVAALAHLNLVGIQPFASGSDSAARLVGAALLRREHYRAASDAHLLAHRADHGIDHRDAVPRALGPRWDPRRADATGWVEWYLDSLAAHAIAVGACARRLEAEFDAVTAALGHVDLDTDDPRLGPRAAIAVWLAAVKGTVTRRHIARFCDVTEETITRDLARLATSGFLTPIGRGRGARYVPGVALQRLGPFEGVVQAALDGGVNAARAHLKSHGGGLADFFRDNGD